MHGLDSYTEILSFVLVNLDRYRETCLPLHLHSQTLLHDIYSKFLLVKTASLSDLKYSHFLLVKSE